MKLLIPDNQHGLTLALQQEIAPRHDIQLRLAEGLSDALSYLNKQCADAVLIPPLASPETLPLTVIEQYVALVETLLASCQRLDMMLIWCVSHQLFEQDHEHLLNEDERPQPLAAALQKLAELESAVRRQWHRHIVLRTSELFGSEGDSMALPEQLACWLAGGSVAADDHLFFAPLSVDAFARAVVGIVLQLSNGAEAWGVFHLSGREPVSQFEFSSAALTCLRAMVAPNAALDLPGAAVSVDGHRHTVRRILGCQKILMTFGIHQIEWRSPLQHYVRHWLTQHNIPLAERSVK